MFSKLKNDEKCQILLGNFYGDGNYQRHKIYRNARYILCKHSNKQRDYVQFLKELYENMGCLQFCTFDKWNKGGFLDGNLCSYVAAKPPNLDFFESSNFYVNNKKIITEIGLSQLHIFGLFLWYLDDGSLCIYKNKKGSKRHARLSTQGWTLDEHYIIQKVFKDKWDLNVKIYGQMLKVTGKYYNYIYFNCTEFKKFFDLLKPYFYLLPDCMKYKFHCDYDDKLSPYNLY